MICLLYCAACKNDQVTSSDDVSSGESKREEKSEETYAPRPQVVSDILSTYRWPGIKSIP